MTYESHCQGAAYDGFCLNRRWFNRFNQYSTQAEVRSLSEYPLLAGLRLLCPTFVPTLPVVGSEQALSESAPWAPCSSATNKAEYGCLSSRLSRLRPEHVGLLRRSRKGLLVVDDKLDTYPLTETTMAQDIPLDEIHPSKGELDRVPHPSHRHAAPSAPWPWVDLDDG